MDLSDFWKGEMDRLCGEFPILAAANVIIVQGFDQQIWDEASKG